VAVISCRWSTRRWSTLSIFISSLVRHWYIGLPGSQPPDPMSYGCLFHLESIPDHPTPSLSDSCCVPSPGTPNFLICGVCVRLLHPTEGVEGKCSVAGSKPRVTSFRRRKRAGAQVMNVRWPAHEARDGPYSSVSLILGCSMCPI
jgi:hypothetical protein